MTDLADVTSTGSGEIITATERTNFTTLHTELNTTQTLEGGVTGKLLDYLKQISVTGWDVTDTRSIITDTERNMLYSINNDEH